MIVTDELQLTEAVLAETECPLISAYLRHENEPAPDPDVAEPWYSLDYTFIVEPGEAWLPTPPVSAKAEVSEP
jgi:hypothetical protein